ncbi:PLP-dependent cysteine synthase family protein [Psychromonas sp. KJ10-10]|uniref:PLP-dependent cysteine synthase family protein n=1 Tax=Psychromonas sp. KJ10-10 TaxID=3391823 RepID=UPI0039B3E782
MGIVTDASQLIGKTPLFELKHIFAHSPARILAKMESFNPTSIKDRAVLNMIRTAMKEGKISKGSEVVEASSGNTAIAIASLGAVMGYKTRIYMSELCSFERQQILCAYGAKVILTPGIEHTKGARDRAIAYCEENPETSFFLNQHSNENNGQSHFLSTGPEIWEQATGKVDAVVIALGTCGTFDGLSRYFKSQNPDIKIIAYEPAGSPVFSGGQQGKHKITGAGPGFITDNFKRSAQHLDEIVLVEDQHAFDTAQQMASKEGLLVGPTSGASIWVAGQLAQQPGYKDKTIICFVYDTGERYLSTPELFPANNIEKVS